MSQATAVKTEPQSNGPADDDVIAVNLHKIRFAQASVDVAKEYLTEVQSHVKGKGIHLKAAKKALAIIKAGDADEWLQETAKITTYLRILRHGITDGQLKLDLETTLAPIEEKAEADGRNVGLDISRDAVESANPHDGNTKAGQAWIRGFRQGRTERDLILSMKNEPDGDLAAEDDED